MLAPHPQPSTARNEQSTLRPHGLTVPIRETLIALAWLALAIPSANAQSEPTPASQPKYGATESHPQKLEAFGGDRAKIGRNANVDDAQIASWVRDLDANAFGKRKNANAELSEVGFRMIPILVQEMQDRDSLEQRTRGFDILRKMATSEVFQNEKAAYAMLQGLEASPDPVLKTRAVKAVMAIESVYRSRALTQLKSRGAILSSQYGSAQQIQFRPNGGGVIAGPVNVPVDPSGNYMVFNENWKGNASDLEMLRFVSGIQQIELHGANIGDEFPAAISKCKSLRVLKIRKTSITDEGMAKLQELPELIEIDVRYTKITKKSLSAIVALRIARAVKLFGTEVSPAETEQLARQLPAGVLIDIRKGGFLGVGPRTVDIRGFPVKGCAISRPQPNSAAERGGLLDGDVIVKYDGKEVVDFDQLRELIAVNEMGDEVAIGIKRGSAEMVKKVVLGEWPDHY